MAAPANQDYNSLAFPFEVTQPCLIHHNGKLFFLGSSNSIKACCYDCSTGQYKDICPLPVTPNGRSYAFLSNHNQSITVIGLKKANYPYQRSFYVEYNIHQNTWTQKDCHFKHGAGFAATTIGTHYLLISGGRKPEFQNTMMQSQDHNSEERYSRKLSLIDLNSNGELVHYGDYTAPNGYHYLMQNPQNKDEALVFSMRKDPYCTILCYNGSCRLALKGTEIEWVDGTAEEKEWNKADVGFTHSECFDGFAASYDGNGNVFVLKNYGRSRCMEIVYHNLQARCWYLGRLLRREMGQQGSMSMLVADHGKMHIVGGKDHYIFDIKTLLNRMAPTSVTDGWYYVDKSGATKGPITVAEVKRLYAAQEITVDSLMWNGRDIVIWTKLQNIDLDLQVVAVDQTEQANEQNVENQIVDTVQIEDEEKKDVNANDDGDWRQWDNEKVCAWVQSLGTRFTMIADTFKVYGVSGEDLAHLNEEELASMGIGQEHLFLRNKLLREIKKL